MRHLILLFTLACTTSFAHAIDCNKASNTMKINECASIEQQKVEAKLNQVYQCVLKGLEKDHASDRKFAEMKKAFVDAQLAWIKFRKAECDAVYHNNIGGTTRNAMYISCMQVRAKQRIAELEEFEKN